MIIDVLSEKADICLQEYVPEQSARLAEEKSDMLFSKPSDLQITFL